MPISFRAADYGVIPASRDADVSGTWLAVFTGGVNAYSARFAEEPEDRALEALMEHFEQMAVAVFPPADAATAPDPTTEAVRAVLAVPEVEALNVSAEQVAAVIDALGGLR